MNQWLIGDRLNQRWNRAQLNGAQTMWTRKDHARLFHIIILAFVAFTIVVMTSCGTVRGIGQDLKDMSWAIEQAMRSEPNGRSTELRDY